MLEIFLGVYGVCWMACSVLWTSHQYKSDGKRQNDAGFTAFMGFVVGCVWPFMFPILFTQHVSMYIATFDERKRKRTKEQKDKIYEQQCRIKELERYCEMLER